MALTRQFPFSTDETGDCTIARLTVMFGGGDGAAVGMLRESMRSATEGADHQVGGAAAAIDVVAETVASGALREKRATYKRFDGTNIDPKEGGGAALHHFEAG